MAAPLVIECPCGEVLATEIHLLLKGEIGHGVTESQRKDRSELIRNADPLHLVFFISSSLCVSVSLWLTSFSAAGLKPGRSLPGHAKCSLQRQPNLPDQTVVEHPAED